MSEHSPDQVIEMAQQRIAQRKEQEHAHLAQRGQAPVYNERPWLYFLAGIAAALLLTLLLWPGLPLHEKMIVVMQGVCSQQHNLYLAGMQLPICARCTGIYMTFLTTLIILGTLGRGRAGHPPPWHISAALVAFVVVMGVDGVNSFLNEAGLPTAYEPRNDLRTITGLGMGVGVATMVMLVFNQALRKDIDDRLPVLKNWFELVGIMVLNVLLLAAAFGNLHLLFWPLAFLSFLGMLGALYGMCVLACSLLLGYSNSITRMSQLARPAVVAVLPTIVIVGGLALFRMWLESQGLHI
jgi:uncharacterized membrane protein